MSDIAMDQFLVIPSGPTVSTVTARADRPVGAALDLRHSVPLALQRASLGLSVLRPFALHDFSSRKYRLLRIPGTREGNDDRKIF